MIPRGHQSESYRKLLAQQEQEDDERKAKLEELRKKQVREVIKRKRDEEEARRQAQVVKEQRQQAVRQAKVDAEHQEKLKVRELEEEQRKRPLSIAEAKERRERADAARNARGLAQLKQGLPQQGKPVARPIMSSRYSDLLAKAPTKLDVEQKKLPSSTGLVPKRDTKQPVPQRVTSPQKYSSTSPSRPTSERADLGSSKPLSSVRAQTVSSLDESPNRRRSPLPVSKNTGSVKRNLPVGSTELQPLQKTKRDLRTIEQIQNDIHREKGKEYSYLKNTPSQSKQSPSVSVKSSKTVDTGSVRPRTKVMPASSNRRPRSPSPSSPSASSYESRPQRSKRRVVDDGLGGESIWDIMNPGKRRDQYLARDIDSDEDMEANADDIRREEQRAAKAAKLEDEREARILKEAEDRKAAKRRKMVS